jgi:23S rRNA pseudouridine1911/1915/1917 synthase
VIDESQAADALQRAPADAAPRCDAARPDPPVLRHRWVTDAPLARTAFLSALRARTGWDAATFDRLLRHGGIHLDGRPHGGDDLPARIGAGRRVDLHALAWEPEPVRARSARILAEGPDWLAVDKPAGVAVQRTRASRLAALETALRVLPGCAGAVAVHRLDRATSGVCLFARDRAAAARLGRAFAAGLAHRGYLAWVAPLPAEARFEVAGWIGRVLDPRRYRFALSTAPRPGFRWSHTRFERLAAARGLALVAAVPTTGRTHQIRVHLAAAGTPVAGDPVYGGAPAARLLLHAETLVVECEEPAITVRAPLPPDFDLPPAPPEPARRRGASAR